MEWHWLDGCSFNQYSHRRSKAWFLYVRGERSKGVSGAVTDASATTLRTNGTLYTGNQSTAVPSGSFTLVGNVYPSAIDFTGLIRNNVNNLFYIWDSKKQVGSSLGVYQTFSGTNGFIPTISGGSYSILVANTTIESGQGFFVTGGATPGGGSITLTEAAKISGTNGNLGFRPSATPAKINSRLYNAANDMLDANVVVFDAAYNSSVDENDAVKLGNPGANFAIETDSKLLAIEGRQPATSNDVVQFRIWNLKPQNYGMEFAGSNIITKGLTAVLEDQYLNSSTVINLDNTTRVNFTIDNNAASAAANRFRITFRKARVAVEVKQGYVIAPNPVNNGSMNLQFMNQAAGKYAVHIMSTAGQSVMLHTINHAGGNSNQLLELPATMARGTYQVEIIAPDKTRTVQQLFVNRK
ncbi:MAG: T9SS type A sorting domain-containing protein [Chitinophagaceae bacterium]|nr:T9SS type A sorting domain-containing protein [Chitinophagaceae bacterium]